MNKKLLSLILVLILLAIASWMVFSNQSKTPLTTPISEEPKIILPSEILTDYTDPSGFSFSYPDNLSITKKEVDDNTYADLNLSSKEVNGSLTLKISDSNFKTLDEWVKLNQKAIVGEPRSVKLGNLDAIEIKTADRLLLGALDQGIFFGIEMPLVEEDFWMKVYNKLLANFSFISPAAVESQTGSSGDDVSFEGEDVIQ